MSAGLVKPSGSFAVRLKAPVFPGAPLSLSVDPDGRVSVKAGGAEALAGQLS
jgi:hypothetical protein